MDRAYKTVMRKAYRTSVWKITGSAGLAQPLKVNKDEEALQGHDDLACQNMYNDIVSNDDDSLPMEAALGL